MDPWSVTYISEGFAAKNELESNLSFEDNFTPSFNFSKLPDSEEYLAVLEAKLKKLKSDPNVLRQLAEKRETCMRQLLSGAIEIEEDVALLDTPVQNSAVLRTVLPHKQALTEGEIVNLLKHDQLNPASSDNESENRQKSE